MRKQCFLRADIYGKIDNLAFEVVRKQLNLNNEEESFLINKIIATVKSVPYDSEGQCLTPHFLSLQFKDQPVDIFIIQELGNGVDILKTDLMEE